MSISDVSSASQSAPVSHSSAKNAKLSALADQFPNLNIGIGTKAKASQAAAGMTGKYNVMVDPAALRAMDSNGKVKNNLEETLGNVEKIHDEVESLVSAGGNELVGLVSFVDKNGKDAGGIVIVKGKPQEGMSEKSKRNMDKLQEKLEEKHKMKLEEEKRAEKKRKQKEAMGIGTDSVELSSSSQVTVQTEGAAASGNNAAETTPSASTSSSSSTPSSSGEAGSGTGSSVDFSA